MEWLGLLILPMYWWIIRIDRRVTRTEEKVKFLYKKNGGTEK